MVPLASLLLMTAALDSPNASLDSIFVNDFEPGVCPRLQLENSNLSYQPDLSQMLSNVDVTEYANIWGRASWTDPVIPWPGVSHNVAMTLNRHLFIAAAFTVPTSGLSPTLSGLLTHGENHPGPPLNVAISTSCGDFNPPSSQCVVLNHGSGIVAHWRLATGSGNGCVLTAGQQYFVNIELADQNAVDTGDCNNVACVISVQSNLTQ